MDKIDKRPNSLVKQSWVKWKNRGRLIGDGCLLLQQDIYIYIHIHKNTNTFIYFFYLACSDRTRRNGFKLEKKVGFN